MSKTGTVLLAGFGGQGILFAGKILANAGMLCSKQVSWLPSYGPEMRGGTANVGVTISDGDIGSPLVDKPEMLLVMNQPSYERFEPAVAKGGFLVADSALIADESRRTDIKAYYIPSTRIANDGGLMKDGQTEGGSLKGLANIIMLGKLIKESCLFDYAVMVEAIKKNISSKKGYLLEPNLRAFKLGFEY